MTTTKSFMNHKKNYRKNDEEDDNLTLADIRSLKITSPEEKMWNDWAFQQQEMYQQQIQASYYQLQYLQQQQMMSMMRQNTSISSSSTSSNSSRRSSTVSSIISNHSRYSNRPSLSQSPSDISVKRNSRPHRISTSSNTGNNYYSINSNCSTPTSTSSSPDRESIKRRQSLGKRIKKVFGMTDQIVSPIIEKKTVITELPKSTIEKKVIPDSPHSSVSSRKGDYRRSPYIDSLPSPASSTVSSTSSTQHSTSSSSTTTSKKSLSFNPVIQLHETFSASEYDRRCDMNTTCQKLTPSLALQIKEELNQFKLNDMSVHIDSRQYTHFFM